MDRNIFLKLCQYCAVIPNASCGMKKNIPYEFTVVYDNIRYYPAGYQLTFDVKGNGRHTAILHSLTANSITYADLSKVN